MREPSRTAYTSRFDEAVALAVGAFRHTFRKSTTIPYTTHLFSVTALVGEHGGDEDQLCAAVLHDYLEDIDPQGAPMLAERFGAHVASMVVDLSDALEHPKPPWKERKLRYLAALGTKRADVKLICTADKLHNVRCTRADVAIQGLDAFLRFNGQVEGTLWYYAAAVEALGTDWTHPLLELLRIEVEGITADVARLQSAER